MVEREPQPKQEVKPNNLKTDVRVKTPRIDIDDLIDRQELETDNFPLNDYEDLGAYLEPYQND